MHVLQPEHSSSWITEVAASISTVPLLIIDNTLAAAADACATVSGISFGPWQQPAMKTPSVVVATGSSLGCFSKKETIFASADGEFSSDFSDIGAWL